MTQRRQDAAARHQQRERREAEEALAELLARERQRQQDFEQLHAELEQQHAELEQQHGLDGDAPPRASHLPHPSQHMHMTIDLIPLKCKSKFRIKYECGMYLW